LTTLKNLMATPNPENPLEADIGTQYTNDRAAFIKTAKEWTKKHGTIGVPSLSLSRFLITFPLQLVASDRHRTQHCAFASHSRSTVEQTTHHAKR
jgi:hypothetical protein